MKQLKLPFEWVHCRYYNDCDAPLCPEDINLKQCLWFPPEPVCRLRGAPEWVKKQRRIARLEGINPEKYFTLRMLRRIEEVHNGLEGADPDLFTGERLWFARVSGRTDGGKHRVKARLAADLADRKGCGTYPLF